MATANLTLSQDSVTVHAFKRSTTPERLSLIFMIGGCVLTEPLNPQPTVRLLPANDLDELPEDAVTLASLDVNGPELTVTLRVDPGKFDPGKDGALVTLKAPQYLAPNRTPITVTRSEDAIWKPLLIGAGGVLAGLAWLGLGWLTPQLGKKAGHLGIPKLEITLFILIALGTGLAASFPTYWNASVWTVDDNGWTTGVAAFAAATASSLTALLKSGKQ